jgi:hypothetical protein
MVESQGMMFYCLNAVGQAQWPPDYAAYVAAGHDPAALEWWVGFGRVVVSEIEAPNLLVNLVYSG